MNDTQYTPWLELGIDELAYYKKRFLETCAELATVEGYWETSLSTSDDLARECISLKAERDAWKVEAMAAREFIGVLAKRLAELAHDEELEDESEKVFRRYMAARVKDGE